MQKRTAYSAWDGNPPNIQYFTAPMPDAPYLPLTGCGTARTQLKSFLNSIERDFEQQTGHYFEYVWESDKDDADTYALQSWEVFRPENGSFEALVVLYYAPINPYLTLQKHFGQDAADEYLESIPVIVDV
ncbi:hypothetical protein [Fortiea contorta]|uniref:hypothetical protein n=1 Tax=Fortiea contorta TaxID=1892405 RepID=UPI0003492A59|nr:hypothetical protein [Fortiea contorta]